MSPLHCKHEEWYQPQTHLNEPWRCSECGISMTPAEKLLWNEIAKLRAEIRNKKDSTNA